MADITELRCWPSCVDALDWSQDGIIALASDENVELLFPNTVSYDRDQEVAQWKHVPLQVPWFTNEEVPIKNPATLTDYSIGEEISASPPIAIAWSRPGIAKHRRCALAALTANLILSIWSADGKQDEGKSWNRRVIVNDALAEYFSTIIAEKPTDDERRLGETMRLRTRIRAFAWATALPISPSFSSLGSRLTYGEQLMAVSNDDNQLAFVVIKSPAASNGEDGSWSTKVLAHISLTPDPRGGISAPFFFDDILKQQRQFSHVSWSPWVMHDSSCRSIIAYTTNEDVRSRLITYTKTRLDIGDEHVGPNVEAQHNGRLKWCPALNASMFTLAVFQNSGLVYLGVSLIDASIRKLADHDLDGRWDQVSGAVWDTVGRSIPRLHFSSMLSTIQSQTAVLEAAASRLMPLGLPSWRDQIENSAVLYSAKNDLKGNTKTKVWGLTPSPMGDFIATCHSVHPSDMIEYGAPNDRRGTVAISGLRQYRDILQGFPAQDVTAEGVLFTLRKLVQNTLENNEQMSSFSEKLVAKLLEAYGPIQGADDITGLSSLPVATELDGMVQTLKRTAFFNPETLKDRYTILVSQAYDKSNGAVLQKLLIAYRLSKVLQELPEALCKTSFSAEIRIHHQKMICMVRSILAYDDAHIQPRSKAGTGPEQTDTDEGPESQGPNSSTSGEDISLRFENASIEDAPVDSCDFCSTPILFIDLATASCMNGHIFPRCGLSLIAIQAPGITKYCGICNTPFLNEEFVAAQEADEKSAEDNSAAKEVAGVSDDESGRHGLGTVLEKGRGKDSLPMTLARVLFLACDVCIYCGGKFVG